MNIQATGELINWTVNGVTILLTIVAASLAIKKNNKICLGVVILGNLSVYYFTRSPLICLIISIICIIWASKSKGGEKKQDSGKQTSKKLETPAYNKKPKKIGNIIGLIIGIGFVVGPLVGYMRQEASLSDPTTQGVLILFALIGGFMIINNLFKLFEKDTSAPVVAAV